MLTVHCYFSFSIQNLVKNENIFTDFDVLSELSDELRQKKEDFDLPFLSLFPVPLIQRPLDNAERFMSLGERE